MDSQIISELILNLMYILGLTLSYFIIVFLKKKIGLENLKKIENEYFINQELAKSVVLYVQKTLGNASNEIKFNEACIALSEILSKKGIILTETEMKVLIESALKMFKKQFGDAWKEEIR